MSRSAVRLSEAEREQRRARDRERLKAGVEQLLCSDGWQRWVRARARNGLSRYSVSNLCLILLAEPEATFVAGFRAWLDLGYCVRKGENAIRILAPMAIKDRDAVSSEASDKTRVAFRAVSVFDRTQVAPLQGAQQAPLQAPREPLSGDSHVSLLESLLDLAGSLGYTVAFEATPAGVGGWCDFKAKRIVVDESVAANAQVRTLIHEIAHALGIDYERYSREQAEVIVDTVTFIVCAGVGLAVDGETLPYVAGWGESGALEAVTEYARTIDTLARRIEDAITQPPVGGAA